MKNSANKTVDALAEEKNIEVEMLEKSIQEKLQKLDIEKTTETNPLLTPHHTINSVPLREHWWSVANAMTISAAVLIFGCIIIGLATFLLYKGKNADEVLRLFGTIIIIIAAVFLVVAGYTDTQIAPVIGLLGTIAGYLLGRRSPETTSDHLSEETKSSQAE